MTKRIELVKKGTERVISNPHVQKDRETSILNLDMEGIKRYKENFYQCLK